MALPDSAAAQTDSLSISFPMLVCLAGVTQNLATYGDIMQIEASGPSTVAVVFFDVRAARDAATALSFNGVCCSQLQQVAVRTVKLPKDMRSEVDSLQATISETWEDEGDSEYFHAECFDSRDALCMALRVRQHSYTAAWLKGEAIAAGLWGSPAAIPKEDLLLGEPVADSSAARGEVEVVVLLENLPVSIATPAMMAAVLQQAGLGHAVLGGRVRILQRLQGEAQADAAVAESGEALVTFSGWRTAEACVRRFQGHAWSRNSAPVGAFVVSPPAARCDSSHRCPAPALNASFAECPAVARAEPPLAVRASQPRPRTAAPAALAARLSLAAPPGLEDVLKAGSPATAPSDASTADDCDASVSGSGSEAALGCSWLGLDARQAPSVRPRTSRSGRSSSLPPGLPDPPSLSERLLHEPVHLTAGSHSRILAQWAAMSAAATIDAHLCSDKTPITAAAALRARSQGRDSSRTWRYATA